MHDRIGRDAERMVVLDLRVLSLLVREILEVDVALAHDAVEKLCD